MNDKRQKTRSTKNERTKGAGNRVTKGVKPSRILLTFADNQHATALFGQYDEHLALIENRLEVRATARGNVVEIEGPEAMVLRAKATLEQLSTQIEADGVIDAGAVSGAIALARANPDSAGGAGNGFSAANITTQQRTVRARTPTQDAYIRAMAAADLTFGIGPAGTGKTYLAVAYAAALMETGAIQRIILSRPAVEAGERLGFLPGDMKEKVDPYLRPLYDALYDVMSENQVKRDITSGAIEIAPLAFMRGRTLANSVVILDEAQNTTAMQMKMFLTRLGDNSKMIVTGDPSQIDLPGGEASGLTDAIGLLRTINKVALVTFDASDVVRHPLVREIVGAYEEAARKRRKKRNDSDADD